ncbi:unnamed protein product [Darwinula stevensoni]|uniref:Methyltransferase FkbM domain-containing protein n=1 Tax=Darwinula stevensoni TaxID=69355 RepID=A0A7R9A3D6_9CRUS|nr:unnamed protein product [Darwinula stevensoni]CAG0887687.1 unnamed protein product [Darwinula stevensoni]
MSFTRKLRRCHYFCLSCAILLVILLSSVNFYSYGRYELPRDTLGMIPPSPAEMQHQESTKDIDPSEEQLTKKIIAPLFPIQDRNNKFFVEAGALDGRTISKTLYLEENYGWTGLLVEPNPHLFQKVITQKRNAWLAPYCLSPEDNIKHELMEYPYDPKDPIASWGGGISNKGKKIKGAIKKGIPIYSTLVKCYPLHMLLDALDITTVHFFSLDVEGLELKVLKTLPFHRIQFHVIEVEFIFNDEGKQALKNFLLSLGYKLKLRSFRPSSLSCAVLLVILSLLFFLNFSSYGRYEQPRDTLGMIPPSPAEMQHQESTKDTDPSEGQLTKNLIAPLFPIQDRNNKFFVEAGALDGRTISKTLYLEENYGWTGLLVEPNPHLFQKMTTQNRNAWLAPYCLSPEDNIIQELMEYPYDPKDPKASWGGGISNEGTKIKGPFNKDIPIYSALVKCYPLHMLLDALM